MGLPDPRIERAALTMRKRGHKLLFLGGRPAGRLHFGGFHEVYSIPMANGLRVAIDPRIRSRWLKRINELKPDVVHAHNIVVANFMLKSAYPTIYDDHEYWSRNLQVLKTRGFIKRIANIPMSRKVPKWEHEILRRFPVITVSEAIAKEHRKASSWVGVVHNYPYLFEVKHLKSHPSREGTVYVGWDFGLRKFKPYRDLTGLKEALDFDVLTGLPHDVLMEKLTHYRVGLNPFLEHPWHKYSDANKTYEYFHAGLHVVTNQLILKSLPNERYASSFKDYSDIRDVVESIPDINAEAIMEHARKKYIWDLQEEIIATAYSKALET